MSNGEDSGLSCSYYEMLIDKPHLYHDGKQSYVAECGEIVSALELTADEMNIFKELWRTAAARLGKQKKGNTELRAAEKQFFYAGRILHKAQFKQEQD